MKRFRMQQIAVVLSMMITCQGLTPAVYAATPSLHNQNKNSMSSQQSYLASRVIRAPKKTPVSSNGTSVSDDLIQEAKRISENNAKVSDDKSKVSDNKTSSVSESSLSHNEVKYTATSPKYRDIVMFHLPYDEFMRINAAWFYEDGMYRKQGVNSAGVIGTCSEASEATVLNRLFNTNVYTENNMLAYAYLMKTCNTSPNKIINGAQSAVEIVQNLNSIGNVTGDMVEANYLTNGFVPDPKRTAEMLISGNQIIMSVASCVLWDYKKEDCDKAGLNYWNPDHWLVVTAPKLDEKNRLLGFYIVDSSGYGVDYLPLSKYKACVWGPSGHEVYNQACIIVKKK